MKTAEFSNKCEIISLHVEENSHYEYILKYFQLENSFHRM